MASISPARACAYRVVRRVFEEDAYADRALHAEAEGLTQRERAFAMALAYATVQRAATLDHVIRRLSSRPPDRLDPPVLAAVRLGLAQLLLLDGVADHAAVHESVELAKRDAKFGAGLVNAVLRRATREGAAIIDGLTDTAPTDAAVKYSVPDWLAQLWFSQLGAERARALLGAINAPAESAIRLNPLAGELDALAAALPVASAPVAAIPEGRVLAAPFDAFGSPQFTAGELMPQSRASMTVARTLDPQPDERILDLCAAPGGKTTHLAALMGDRGRIVAVERHPGRAQALQRTLERMRVTIATVVQRDAAQPAGDTFDRVLVDPPCSGLGTLQSRPDLRWRTGPGRIADLTPVQTRILAAGAEATRAGGTLVYSVCTISRAESDDVIAGFLAERDDWELVDERRLAPDTDRTDGFYIARLGHR